MPDPLRVSLTEVDRRWSYIQAGKEYHGEAVNPWNLSFFERWIGHGRGYNRARDEEDRYLFFSYTKHLSLGCPLHNTLHVINWSNCSGR